MWERYFREATKEEIEEQHPTPEPEPTPEPTPEPEPAPEPEFVVEPANDPEPSVIVEEPKRRPTTFERFTQWMRSIVQEADE